MKIKFKLYKSSTLNPNTKVLFWILCHPNYNASFHSTWKVAIERFNRMLKNQLPI